MLVFQLIAIVGLLTLLLGYSRWSNARTTGTHISCGPRSIGEDRDASCLNLQIDCLSIGRQFDRDIADINGSDISRSKLAELRLLDLYEAVYALTCGPIVNIPKERHANRLSTVTQSIRWHLLDQLYIKEPTVKSETLALLFASSSPFHSSLVPSQIEPFAGQFAIDAALDEIIVATTNHSDFYLLKDRTKLEALCNSCDREMVSSKLFDAPISKSTSAQSLHMTIAVLAIGRVDRGEQEWAIQRLSRLLSEPSSELIVDLIDGFEAYFRCTGSSSKTIGLNRRSFSKHLYSSETIAHCFSIAGCPQKSLDLRLSALFALGLIDWHMQYEPIDSQMHTLVSCLSDPLTSTWAGIRLSQSASIIDGRDKLSASND